jgi:hypothetical protein
MAITNATIEVDGATWLVRQAQSKGHAISAINFARVTGSVGSKTMHNDTVLADVVQLNSDGTERKPGTQVY